MATRPAAGGGRWVDVPPERLARWLDGFAERHGAPTAEPTPDGLDLTAPDGARAQCHLPFGWPPGADNLTAAALAPHRFGLLLARQAALAAGVVDGTRLVATKVETRYVQGRTAAGGWSQQRYARRRANQAKAAAQSGAEAVAALLLPAAGNLAALVTGGDRRTIDTVLADPRLAPLAALRTDRFLDVPEPRRAVLAAAVEQARAVRIRITP